MKKIMKKNQIIITALAIMIAVAGYLNFSGKGDLLTSNLEDSVTDVNNGAEGNQDDEDVSAAVTDNLDEMNTENAVLEGEGEDVALEDGANLEDAEEEDDAEIGEAVLTGSDGVSLTLSQAKLNREQVRSKSKEMLLEIINNAELTEAAKAEAIQQMLNMTKVMEKESAAETQLAAKGFAGAIVNISDDFVDVTVNQSELSDVERTQIEDIITRKTGFALNEVVITTIKSEN